MKREIFVLSMIFSALCAAETSAAGVPEKERTEFWGRLGFAYQAQDEDWRADSDLSDSGNNSFSATVLLGTKRSLGSGFSVGIELAGWSDFGWSIAENPRVEAEGGSGGELSGAYLEYAFGSGTIRAGRQELSKNISPWAWTVRTAGVADWVYDGILYTVTPAENMKIVAGWISQMSHNSDEELSVSDSAGMFMLSMLGDPLKNTRLSVTAYYLPQSRLNPIYAAPASTDDTWSLWGSLIYGEEWKFGVQAAFVDGSVKDTALGRKWNSTCAAAAMVSHRWGDFDITLAASYINDGDYSLRAAGSGEEDSALWTQNEISADSYGADQWALLAKASYALSFGRIYGTLGCWDFDRHSFRGDEKNAAGARAGYKFSFRGIDAKIEYRHRRVEYYDPAAQTRTRQRIRLEAYYSF